MPKHHNAVHLRECSVRWADGGAALSNDEQSKVNDLIIELEERGKSQVLTIL